jgi:hypothetical protein
VCHAPQREPESLFPLLSSGELTLSLSFPEALPAEVRAAFAAKLRGLLDKTRATVRPDGTPGAAPVKVEVSIRAEEGRTADDRPYYATRADATIRLHRAELKLAARPGVSRDARAALDAALEDLAARVATALTY